MTKTKKICVAVPVMGGKPRTFGSVSECCRVLHLSEGSVRRALPRGEYRGKQWIVYQEQVVFPVSNPNGMRSNFKIKK